MVTNCQEMIWHGGPEHLMRWWEKIHHNIFLQQVWNTGVQGHPVVLYENLDFF